MVNQYKGWHAQHSKEYETRHPAVEFEHLYIEHNGDVEQQHVGDDHRHPHEQPQGLTFDAMLNRESLGRHMLHDHGKQIADVSGHRRIVQPPPGLLARFVVPFLGVSVIGDAHPIPLGFEVAVVGRVVLAAVPAQANQ